jgi:hypothetical protein
VRSPTGDLVLLHGRGFLFPALGPVGPATTATAGTAAAVIFNLPVLAMTVATATALAVAVAVMTVSVVTASTAALMAEATAVAVPTTTASPKAMKVTQDLGDDRSQDEATNSGPQGHAPVLTHQTQPFLAVATSMRLPTDNVGSDPHSRGGNDDPRPPRARLGE